MKPFSVVSYTLFALALSLTLVSTVSLTLSAKVTAQEMSDSQAIELAVQAYIQSQHQTNADLMASALHNKLAKRTYWQYANGTQFIMESNFTSMLRVAKSYNKNGDKFSTDPRIVIKVLDIDQRAASVKLTTDDWIDYMHLVKNQQGEWKILNVLWQYHDITRHSSK